MHRNARKIELPPNFAQTLLDCQIEYKLNSSPSTQQVKSLIQLYSLGVEYYQSIRSHKYLYFQLKINQLFATERTIHAINDKHDSQAETPLKKKLRSKLQQDKIEAIRIKQKQQKMWQEIAESTTESTTAQTVKKMIDENDLKTMETNEKVKKQIQLQNAKLKQKLQKRKQRQMFSKSVSNLILQNQTKDTLLTDTSTSQLKLKQISDKIPIKVSFNHIIKENESDDDKVQKVAIRRKSISQDPSKKIRVQIDTSLNKINLK